MVFWRWHNRNSFGNASPCRHIMDRSTFITFYTFKFRN